MEFLQDLTSISLPDGEFSLRTFIDSPMTLVSFSPAQLGAHLSLTLNAAELSMLGECVQLAKEFLTSTKPTNAVRYLGWFAPRPLAARVVAIHYQDGRQVLLISFYQNNRVFDAMLDMSAQQALQKGISQRLSSLPQKAHRTGRFEVGVGLVLDSGEQPLRLEGLTHFWGPYGEFFQPSEICATVPAQIDCLSIEGKLYALRGVVASRPRSLPAMPQESPEFVEFCRSGLAADDLLISGGFAKAARRRSELIETMKKTGKVDAYILSKLALGKLLSQTLCADFRPALTEYVQMADAQDLEGLGLMMLAKGQVAYPDYLLYAELEATLISVDPRLADGEDPEVCINSAMSEIFMHALEHKDPWLAALVLRNWKLHLSNLYQGREVPGSSLQDWAQHQEQLPLPVQPKVLCYRWPEIWYTEQAVVTTIGAQGVVSNNSPNEKAKPTPHSEAPAKPWWKRILGS